MAEVIFKNTNWGVEVEKMETALLRAKVCQQLDKMGCKVEISSEKNVDFYEILVDGGYKDVADTVLKALYPDKK